MLGKTVGDCLQCIKKSILLTNKQEKKVKRMKKDYIAPHTERTEVELEQGFMNASVVDSDEEPQATISIENQEVGAESNYFDGENQSGWDY